MRWIWRRAIDRARIRGLLLAAASLLVVATKASGQVRRVVTGLDRPVFATAPAGDRERLFIVEQRGEIEILDLETEMLAAEPFLTVPGLAAGGEQGLLGLAFHPDYAVNGRFFVYYTETGGASVIAEYGVSADPDIALPDERRRLVFGQPQANHNGGWIGFGPDDGYLYIATGDGGNGNDQGPGHTPDIGNAQDLTDNLLGKILRIDVDGDAFPSDPLRSYAIPPDNPFAGSPAGDDEIWHWGLRNPYRASFDRATGDLYIGDVGQGACEEIDLQPADVGGLDFGWRMREGTIATPNVGGEAPGATSPIFDYSHGGGLSGCTVFGFAGCSVTGGVVYRGPSASLRGRYFFSDFCTGRLWSFRFDGSDPIDFDGGNITELTDHTSDPAFGPDLALLGRVSGFGEDAAGSVYILTLLDPVVGASSGSVFLLPEPSPSVAAGWALAALGLLRGCAADARRFGRDRRIRPTSSNFPDPRKAGAG